MCGSNAAPGEPLEMSDGIKDKIQWLKENTEPADQVQEYMRATFEYRSKTKKEASQKSFPSIQDCWMKGW